MGDSFGKFIKNPGRVALGIGTLGGSELIRGGAKSLGIGHAGDGDSGGAGAGPYDGMAQYPGFDPGDSSAYNELSKQATNPGDSPWLLKAGQAQDASIANELDKAKASVPGATATATDNLAARGGLSSGARERIQEGGQKSILDMTQNLNQQGNLNKMNAGVQDAGNKMNMLGQAGQMEFAKNNQKNDYNMRKYEADMQAWGAGKAADATANSGKK